VESHGPEAHLQRIAVVCTEILGDQCEKSNVGRVLIPRARYFRGLSLDDPLADLLVGGQFRAPFKANHFSGFVGWTQPNVNKFPRIR
jgi:hypothetical protein